MAATDQAASGGLTDGIVDKHYFLMVRFSPHQTYSFDVEPRNTIRDLKDMVAKRAVLAVNSINLVLAGRVLPDNQTLQGCDLGSQTTLHAFCWADDGLQSCGLEKAVESSSVDYRREFGSSVDGDITTITTSTSSSHDNSRFFVFCKLCECIQRGRLRVKCRQCDSGAFLLDRGPSDWEDISCSTSLRGRCTACERSVPLFYMRCIQDHPGEEAMGTVAALKHVRANRRRVGCIICADVSSHVLVFPCTAGHVICLSCFEQYCSHCLSERNFVEHQQHGYTVPCPAGCPDSHLQDSHHFLLMGKDKYERYKNFAAEEFVLQNGGILCPAQGCGTGLFPKDGQRTVRCEECQYECCRECRRESHPGSCEEYLHSLLTNEFSEGMNVDEEQAAQACWEHQSLLLIEETTKMCPHCKTSTERTGGCMHMVCSRCGGEWCWICVKEWNRDCQADHWFG